MEINPQYTNGLRIAHAGFEISNVPDLLASVIDVNVNEKGELVYDRDRYDVNCVCLSDVVKESIVAPLPLQEEVKPEYFPPPPLLERQRAVLAPLAETGAANPRLRPPRVFVSVNSSNIVNDKRKGAVLSKFAKDVDNRMLRGFLNYFAISDLFPFVYYMKESPQSLREYYEFMVDVAPREWRGVECFVLVKGYFLARPTLASEILALCACPPGVYIRMMKYVRNYGHFAYLGRTVSPEVAEVQGLFSDMLYEKITQPFTIRRKWKNVGLSSPRYRKVSETDALAKTVFGFEQSARVIIQIETCLYFLRKGMYRRAFAQLYCLAVDRGNMIEFLKIAAEGCMDMWDLSKVQWGDPEDWSTDLERESSSDEEPEVVEVQNLEALKNSSIFKKFMLVVTSLISADFVKIFPSSIRVILNTLGEYVVKISSATSVVEAIAGFVKTLVTRCAEFMETWDWRVFLRDGGFDTWIERGNDLFMEGSGKGKNSKYPTAIEYVAAMREWLDEGDRYRKADLHRVALAQKFTPQFEKVYQMIFSVYIRITKQMEAVAQRKKEPYADVLAGPPGCGKTTLNESLTRFHLRVGKNREMDAEGNPISTGADMYSVPNDKHWNGCVKPEVVVFNDLRGDGYTSNGTTTPVPEMLRLAVDREPFYTPQADLADKLECVIDPAIVSVTTNDMVWNFALFGTNWSKLLRRYPISYYIAYPADCYKVDIELHGNDHGELNNPNQTMQAGMDTEMRIYSMTLIEKAGKLTFKREHFLGTGLGFLDNLRKRNYLEWASKEGFNTNAKGPRCNMDTPIGCHPTGPCLKGCTYVPAVVAVQCTRMQAVAMVEGMSDSIMDRAAEATMRAVIRRRAAKLVAQYKKIKQFCTENAVKLKLIAAGLLAVGITATLVYTGFSEKKDEAIGKLEGSVINPVKNAFTTNFLTKYGGEHVKAQEMASPPKYPNDTRAYVTASPVSNTSSFRDVCQLVAGNTYSFVGANGYRGKGTFISAEYLLMNTHVFNGFGDTFITMAKEADNDYTYKFLPERVSSMDDFTVLKVPTFAARNIIPHFATSVGSQMKVNFGGMEAPARRIAVTAGPFGLWKDTKEVLEYDLPTNNGDCGILSVAEINGKGAIVSMHFAKLSNDRGAGYFVTQDLIKNLVARLPGKATDFKGTPFVTDVEGLHARSKFRSMQGVSARVLGTFETAMHQSKSRFVPTPLNELARGNMNDVYVVPALQVDGVMSNGEWFAPYIHKFKGMAISPGTPNPAELKRAIADYLNDCPIASLSPISLEQVINGVDGDHLLKSMNLKTSAGVFQRFYPDKSFLVSREEISQDLLAYLELYIEALEDSILVEHQKWALKDELVTLKKELIKKYRYFMINDFVNLFAFRAFVAPIIAHMYRHKEFFETYGAFNPASPEFGVMFERLKSFGLHVAADLKHMDSSHRSVLADAVAEIITEIGAKCGYNEKAQNVVRNLVRSVVFTLVELNGDLAFFTEGMGSGVYITFVFNCLVLCLLYRVAWFRVSSEAFRDHNALVCGGDDSALGTDCPEFDGIHIQKVFLDFGYELSPPTDKTGVMCDFFDWSDFVFLKRSPKTLVYQGRTYTVGALAEDSIWKSLGWELPSPSITHNDRMAQVLDAGQREFALHGEEKFNWFLSELSRVNSPYLFRKLTYSDVMERYVAGKLYDELLERFVSVPVGTSVVSLAEENQTAPARDHHAEIGVQISVEAVQGDNGLGPMNQAGGDGRTGTPSRYTKINRFANFIGNDAGGMRNERTTTFEMASDMVGTDRYPLHPVDYGGIKEPISLGDTLSRPTYLYSFDWTPVTTNHTIVADLYTLWRTDPSIANKLAGFKFFRGRPIIRFVVNGFSFYYGKLVCAADLNPGSDTLAQGLNPQINTVQMLNVAQALQAPNISVDPSVSTTYDLEVPFYSATGWYNLFNIPIAPILQLHFWVFNGLASANDVPPTSVNIKVYLIMEDVELSVPAVAAIQNVSVVEVQGKKSTEEAPSGTLSKPLMVVSKAAGFLKSVPALSWFMTPLEMASDVGAGLAASLGFGRPTILEESRPTLNQVVDPTTYMSGRSAITKLTADPRQAVAVTAAAATVGDDSDMLISNIIHRFGLIGTGQWTTSGYIDSYSVSPGTNLAIGGGNVQLTPLGWVSSRFKYWSGSIVFRIEIVASGFHRGAIGISWVPYSDPPGGNPLNWPNKFLTKIVDITQTKVVDFVVPYAADMPNTDRSGGNGFLRLYEINPLRSSGSTSAVSVNIYMAAGEDFELYRPTTFWPETNATYVSVGAIQGDDGSSAVAVANPTHSVGNETSDVVEDVTPGREKIYFGENFTSIKQLMNRHCLWYSGILPATPTSGVMSSMYHQQYPLLPLEPAATQLPSSVVMGPTFQAWFAPGFLAMRGGSRFKWLLKEVSGTTTVSVASPYNTYASVNTSECGSAAGGTSFTGQFTPVSANPAVNRNAVATQMAESANGSIVDSLWIHNALEYEVPHVTPARFVNPRKFLGLYKPSLLEAPVVKYTRPSPEATMNFELWASAGDDFSLHYFMYVPQYRICSQDVG